MHGWFWEMYQHREIGEAARTAGRADARAADLQRRLDEAERKVELLVLTTLALAELLRERGVVTEAELAAKVKAIDLMDGRLDWRADVRAGPGGGPAPISSRSFTSGVESGARPRRCVTCRRTIAPQHETCFYCGGELVDGPVPPKK